MRRPAGSVRGVGWADCQIVHAAHQADLLLLTGDGDQRALWDASRRGV